MTENIIKQILFFIYSSISTFGTGYVVFWKAAHPAWFILAIFLCLFYGAFAFFSEEDKKDG